MRVVFMGTPQFAATILEEIAQQHQVVAVYTRPDAVSGRGGKLVGSPVRKTAERMGLPVHTPKSLRGEDEVATLRAYDADVFFVAAYGMILPDEVIDLPKKCVINAHASLLPRWRGAAPIERAILAGDEEIGVCIMRIAPELDAGDYCVSRSIPCEGTATELFEELAMVGAQAALTALAQIEDGRVAWTPQDPEQVTYAAKIAPGELNLSPADACVTAVRKVMASSDAHASRCVIAGKEVALVRAHIPNADDFGGEVPAIEQGSVQLVRKRHLLMGVSDGAIELDQVKPAGKKLMDATSFAAGVQGAKNGVAWEELNGR